MDDKTIDTIWMVSLTLVIILSICMQSSIVGIELPGAITSILGVIDMVMLLAVIVTTILKQRRDKKD